MKKSFTQEKNFIEKFQLFDFIDNARWNSDSAKSGRKSLINYYRDDLTDDEKLLTHWICYITERQIGFEIVWDKGGAVFSEAVREFTSNGNEDLSFMKPSERGTCFKRKAENDYVFSGLTPYENLSEDCRKRLAPYYRYTSASKNATVEFKSRFYSSDYVSTLYTFYTLTRYEKSLTNFLATVINAIDKLKDLAADEKTEYYVKAMGFALYLLTYKSSDQGTAFFQFCGEQVTKSNIERFYTSGEFRSLANLRADRIAEYFDTSYEYDHLKDVIDKFYCEDDRFVSMKRVWCALRDFLKSPEFKTAFKTALTGKITNDALNALFGDYSPCRFVELPGDVWNENTLFRQCLTVNTKGKLGELLRSVYKEQNIKIGYPEQFDATFDFAPRMCEKENCEICPFAKYSENKRIRVNEQKISRLCVNNKDKYCPLMLLYCGYYFKCVGNDCFLKKSFDLDDEN